jgi:hypothetical protein
MSTNPLGLAKTTFDEGDIAGYGFTRSLYTGIPTSYWTAGNEPISCGSTEVALVDEVVLSSLTNDAASNHTVTLQVNGLDLPIHFPGTVDQAVSDRIVWKPKGNLVVHPSQTLNIKCGTAGQAFARIRYRKMRMMEAIARGFLTSLPSVCSTNTVTGSGTAAATAKQILAPVAGYSVEVLGFTLTGHNYNAAADNIRLGFWDGTTGGTFASGGATIFRGYARGASRVYAPRVLVGNTRGCIQGPSGYGLYIQATTNMAGATPPADFNVLYRLRKDTDVVSTSGTPGATPAVCKKFWCYTESIAELSTALGNNIPFFGTFGSDPLVRIRGHVGTAISGNTATGNNLLGLGVGANITNGAIAEYVPLQDDRAAGANQVSRSWFDDEMIVNCRSSQTPGFGGIDTSGATALSARSQLVWGTLQFAGATGSNYQGVS